MTKGSVSPLEKFELFVRMVFRGENDGTELGDEPYLLFLCHELERAAEPGARTVLNMPPRHLKSTTATVSMAAWFLARYPAEKIIMITYSQQLAEDLAYRTRKIMQSAWYKRHFVTRLAKDRRRVDDFGTTAGGGVFAASVDGSFIGRGASLIIIDDPLDMDDAGNLDKINEVNARFDTAILSRLNNPTTGRVIINMHRLAENDLSGHVLQSGDWRHIALPFIAPQDKVYRSDQRAWVRHRGDLLRPKAFSVAEIARIKQIINPDFEALYQQFLGETAAIKLSGDQFGSFVIAPGGPVVISVDPGHRAGPGHSFTVMQAWQRDGDNFLVLDQWRQQSGLDQAIKALRVGLARSRASAVLIEQTGYGEALARGLKRMAGSSDIRLVPTGQDSKTVRLLRHIEVIAAGRIKLPAAAEWREAWVNEFEQFPRGSSDDQVDALTQFLDFLANGPILRPPRQSCVAGTVNGRGVFTTGEEWTRRLGPGNVAFVKGAHRGRIFPPA